MSDIGEEIKTRRESAGLTQRELGQISGVHQVTIAKIETGKATNLRLQTIGKLRTALESVETGRSIQPSPKIEDAKAMEGEAYICIPRLDVSVSAGLGCDRMDSDDVIDMIRISRSWLSSNVQGTPDSLAIISAKGDSMEPTLKDGDLLLVDKSAQLDVDALFVFTIKGQLFVKRLQRMPDGSVLAISDNKNYREFVIDESTPDFRVLGRMVFVWRGEKL